MVKQIFLTDDGLKKLEQELEHLKTFTRNEVAEKIKVALSFGDLSENSEYDEAKNEQAKVEARIAELESMLVNVQVINEAELPSDSIHVGSKVTLLDEEFNEEVHYRIVGSTEADPAAGLISDESPLGKALIGAKEGDRVHVDAPVGELMFTVRAIEK